MKILRPNLEKKNHKKNFEHQFILIFVFLFLFINWEILIALTGVNETLSARADFVRGLNLGFLNVFVPLVIAGVYIVVNPRIQRWLERLNPAKVDSQPLSEIEKATALLFNSYSEIGLAGKNVIDETLIYSTAQENFLKKNSLSSEEIIWAREELCLKYQDSIKKIQEFMIVLSLQNQEKVMAMHQRLKEEKRI